MKPTVRMRAIKCYQSGAFSIGYTKSIPICPGYIPSHPPTPSAVCWRDAEYDQWKSWVSAHVLSKDFPQPAGKQKRAPPQTTSADPEILFGKDRVCIWHKEPGIFPHRDSVPDIPFSRCSALRNIHLLKDVTLYRSSNLVKCPSATLFVADNT